MERTEDVPWGSTLREHRAGGGDAAVGAKLGGRSGWHQQEAGLEQMGEGGAQRTAGSRLCALALCPASPSAFGTPQPLRSAPPPPLH